MTGERKQTVGCLLRKLDQIKVNTTEDKPSYWLEPNLNRNRTEIELTNHWSFMLHLGTPLN